MARKIKIGKNIRVDIEEQIVWIGKTKYWRDVVEDAEQDEEDYGDDEYWCKGSKRWAEDEDGHRFRIEEDLDLEEAELSRCRVRIRNRKIIKLLNRLLKEAKAQAKESTDRKRPAGKEDEDDADFSQKKHEDEDSEESDEAVNQKVNEEKGEKQTTGLSVRIKSSVSSFSLMFRILPSKKHPDLWNLAVYRDNRLMGYVDVELSKVLDLGKKLLELK